MITPAQFWPAGPKRHGKRQLCGERARHIARGNTGSGVWADAAYRSEKMEAKLRDRKVKSHIHRKGKRPSRVFSKCPAGRWASR